MIFSLRSNEKILNGEKEKNSVGKLTNAFLLLVLNIQEENRLQLSAEYLLWHMNQLQRFFPLKISSVLFNHVKLAGN
uniref:Uncharacterized protein n=1 Tax=Rhizophora mucronata TaxID=61149 RepID=A0A2P2NHU0_RHIMU